MSTAAVFIALGGSSYAALKITSRNVPKDALTGADIKNLTGRDVRNNSLTGADVKSLTSADVANGRLLAEDFASGQLPRGEKGEAGATGAPGAALAYARIDTNPMAPGGVVDDANSKNVTDAQITTPENGVICFNNLTFDPKSVTATVENAGLDFRFMIGHNRDDEFDQFCPGQNDAYVVAFNDAGAQLPGAYIVYVVFN
jgi:hypothetical protein